MQKIVIIACGIILLGGCSSKSKVNINRTSQTVQTNSRSEPIFYNGKTYQLDYTYAEGQGAFDMKVSGLGPKQQQDAVNIATSSLGYFACPDGQRGKIIGQPIYVDRKWNLSASCAA